MLIPLLHHPLLSQLRLNMKNATPIPIVEIPHAATAAGQGAPKNAPTANTATAQPATETAVLDAVFKTGSVSEACGWVGD